MCKSYVVSLVICRFDSLRVGPAAVSGWGSTAKRSTNLANKFNRAGWSVSSNFIPIKILQTYENDAVGDAHWWHVPLASDIIVPDVAQRCDSFTKSPDGNRTHVQKPGFGSSWVCLRSLEIVARLTLYSDTHLQSHLRQHFLEAIVILVTHFLCRP